MNPKIRTFLIWVVLLSAVCGLSYGLSHEEEPAYGTREQLAADLQDDAIVAWRWDDQGGIVVVPEVGDPYLVADHQTDDLRLLTEAGIPVEYETPGLFGLLGGSLLTVLLPLVLLVGALVYFVRRQQAGGGAGNILQLRNNPARKVGPGVEKTRFADVGGAVEAKERLADVVDFLKQPRRWTDAGARPPRGVLLEGPPGSGKTLLARAVAGEAGVPVFVASGSEFVEMFVGVGAARIRDLFAQARKAAPAVVFIDELDAIGRRRGAGVGTGHDEREHTLNQLLVCMDGFEPNDRVVVLAATNRADVLDRALLRPGRFDARVALPDPTAAERVDILRIHTRGKKLAADVSLDALAQVTPGYTGAALEHLANEATLAAVRRARKDGVAAVVARADFEAVLAAPVESARGFDKLDAVLLESASQLARPTGRTALRVELTDGTVLEGGLVWADAAFLKLEHADTTRIVPKVQIRTVQALAGTDAAVLADLVGDRWARANPDVV